MKKKNYDSMCMEFGEYDHEKEDGERRSEEKSKQNEKNYSDEDVNKFNRMMERELRNDVISNIKIRAIFVFLLFGLLILIFAITS